ncbi:hypothetical protein J3F84DRAFT_382602 [Trichoderma pleuroticola]
MTTRRVRYLAVAGTGTCPRRPSCQKPRAPQPLLCFQSKNRRQFGCENNPLPRDQFSDWPAPTSPRLPCTSTSDLRLDRSPPTFGCQISCPARFVLLELALLFAWPVSHFFELPICPFVVCALLTSEIPRRPMRL